MFAVKMSVAGAIFALAGCDGFEPDALVKALPGGVTPAATSLALYGGDVVGVGPQGYCVDPDSSRPSKGFAILAPCATLGVEGAPAVIRGITTIQAGPEGSASVSADADGFAAYLKGPDATLMLSRSGEAATVTVTEVRKFAGHVAVYLRDAAPAHIDGAQESEWRAFVDIAGRLLTISVRGLDAAPLNAAEGSSLLDQAVAAMFAANPAKAN